MTGVIILKCSDCKPHQFQDARYGSLMRVMNGTLKPEGWRCTVCGSVHDPRGNKISTGTKKP